MTDRKRANRNVSLRLKKYTQMKKCTENSAAGGANVDGQTEELRENRLAVVGNEEGKMEMVGFKNGDSRKNAVMASGGYSKESPPVDDCCPICFDDFHIPCRTNCGHWFCANCILQLWKYMANFKQCACPICGALVFNVVPHPSVLIQQDEEVSKVLKDISKYNNQNMVGCFRIFMRAVALPVIHWRRFQLIHSIGVVLRYAYEAYDFQFFPDGAHGIRGLFFWCNLAVLIFAIWRRYRTIWRDRRLAETMNRMQ